MTTVPGSAPATHGRADEQFLELVCADDEWLRSEFDAIIAAEFPQVPSAVARRGTTGGRGGEQSRRHATAVVDRTRPHQPVGVDRWTRQRSPPSATADSTAGRLDSERQVISPDVNRSQRGARPHRPQTPL